MPSTLPSGILAASLTPLTEAGSPDGSALADHVQRLLDEGCDAVLLFGTTGEGFSFTVEERQSTLERVLEQGVPSNRLLVGTGALAIPDAVALTRHATKQGVGGVLIPPPFHLPSPSTGGIIDVYHRLIEQVNSSDLTLYFYHYPELFGCSVSFLAMETLQAAHPTCVGGVKDSSGDWEHTEALCGTFPDLQIFSGTERLLVQVLRAGGAGCISATVNFTAPIADAVRQRVREGKDVESAEKALIERRDALAPFPTIPALKQMMAWRTNHSAWRQVRPPLTPLDEEEMDRLKPIYEETEITCAEWRLGTSERATDY